MGLALAGVYATDGLWGALLALPLAATVGYVSLLLFWFPRVEVTEDLVIIKNVFRTYLVPIRAIARIDTKWALALILPSGKKITSWSATAPGRHSSLFASRDQGQHLPESTYLAGTVRPGDLITSDSGAAAAAIRRLWEASPKDGVGEIGTRWHKSQILVLGALLLTSVLSIS